MAAMTPQVAIELQPFQAQDIPRLCGWLQTARDLLIWGGPYYRFPLTSDALSAVIDSKAVATGTHRLYRVSAPAMGAVIGHAELVLLNSTHRSVRLARLLIGPAELRGRGYGQALVRALLDLAHGDFALHRVELEVYDFNTAAIRCYERCGFQIEGVRRHAVRFGDAYWNSVMMASLSPKEDV